MAGSFLRFIGGLLLGLQALQLLHGTDLPLFDLEELVSSGITHTDFLDDAARTSNTPYEANLHVVAQSPQSLLDTQDVKGHNDDFTEISALAGESAPHIRLPAASSSGIASGSADPPASPLSSGGAMPGALPGQVLIHGSGFLLPIELSVPDREMLLESLRQQLFRISGAKRTTSKILQPLISPYLGRLTLEGFGSFVAEFAQPTRPPFLWDSGSSRFLLRQSSPNSDMFQRVNGFKTGDRHRIFYEAFVEMVPAGSEHFQYLGVLRMPSRQRTNDLQRTTLDGHVFLIKKFTVLSSSTFATKRLRANGIENS